MASQVINGKAFEWAVGNEICESYGFEIEDNAPAKQNKECFLDASISEKQREIFKKNAANAVKHIFEKERICETGKIRFLADQKGEDGDVRDIVVVLSNREFGLSCKTNHEAYKHSRLSDSLDFVKKWKLHPDGCSSVYLDEVKAIFGELRRIKKNSSGKALWADVENVPYRFYWPVLNAFQKEIERVHAIDGNMCKNFIKYLIGSHDFYKIISKSNEVSIGAFNLNGALSVSIPQLPDKIDLIKDKNSSQYSKTIVFSKGWTFNFRIHSASSRVEPSLKFDINAISLSPKLYTHHITLD